MYLMYCLFWNMEYTESHFDATQLLTWEKNGLMGLSCYIKAYVLWEPK